MKTSKLYFSYSNVKNAKLIPSKEYSINSDIAIIYTIYMPDFIHLKSELSEFLNPKELKKAQRFYKEIDRDRFIIYRSILKFVLAAYTKLDIKSISFDYQLNKKPYLASHPRLHFNMSHSEDFAVIAISRKKVGLDIEFMSENFKFTSLLPDVFDEKQIQQIQNAVNTRHAFYTSWTRKEAFVKALGKGIDEDFKNIPCLDGQHNVDSKLLRLEGQNSQNSAQLHISPNWQVYSFDFADNYLGAIAYEGLSKISKNLILYSVPNNMNDLLHIAHSSSN